MSENLNKLYTTQFTDNLQLNLAQHGTLLRGLVMTGSHVGKMASPVEYMKPISSRTPAGRFAPMERTDADFQRRWVFPVEKDVGPQMIDGFDRVQTITNPQSQYVTNAADACGRDWDDAIVNAAFGTAYTGVDASGISAGSETFDTTAYGISEKFGNGSTAIGATVEKLIEAQRLFDHLHVPQSEPRTWIIGSQQHADLLKLVQVVSTEFNERPVLVDGRVTRFMGFNIVISERLGYGTGIGSSSNCRKTIAFVKSGLYLGMWKDMTSDVSVRNDLSGLPWQLYVNHMFGATRLEPGRVLRIDCGNDSTGADNI